MKLEAIHQVSACFTYILKATCFAFNTVDYVCAIATNVAIVLETYLRPVTLLVIVPSVFFIISSVCMTVVVRGLDVTATDARHAVAFFMDIPHLQKVFYLIHT